MAVVFDFSVFGSTGGLTAKGAFFSAFLASLASFFSTIFYWLTRSSVFWVETCAYSDSIGCCSCSTGSALVTIW